MSFLDKLVKELEGLVGTNRVPVKVSVDGAGFIDRVCPNATCGRGLKDRHEDDDRFGDTSWCVYCGHNGPAADFATADQARHFGGAVLDHAQTMFNQTLRRAAESTPRSRKTYGGKYASMTVTESVQAPPELTFPEREPPEAWAVMRVEASCKLCACHFAGIGGGVFCPACGHRSTDLTFDEALRRIRDELSKEHALEVAIGTYEAADLMAKLAEVDVQQLVTAFEAFAKESFPRLASLAPSPPKNAFQNLKRAEELWTANGGRAFDSIVSPGELAELARFFQQRHVLTHNGGIVDAGYRTHSGDTTYEVGQRLAIKPEQVVHMAELVEKLVNGLRADLHEGDHATP